MGEEKRKSVQKKSSKKDALYNVESILDEKIENGKVFVLVKWEGYEETTWEPEKNMSTVKHLVSEYREEKLKKKSEKTEEIPEAKNTDSAQSKKLKRNPSISVTKLESETDVEISKKISSEEKKSKENQEKEKQESEINENDSEKQKETQALQVTMVMKEDTTKESSNNENKDEQDEENRQSSKKKEEKRDSGNSIEFAIDEENNQIIEDQGNLEFNIPEKVIKAEKLQGQWMYTIQWRKRRNQKKQPLPTLISSTQLQKRYSDLIISYYEIENSKQN